MHMLQPAATAILPASTFVAMPPEPTSDAEPPAIASISGVMPVTSGMNLAVRVARWIGGVQTIDVGEQHEAVGARHLGDARREPVVVAVADLGGRHGVVLVDDRDRAELEQRIERAARIQVAAPLFGVAEGQQHLRDRAVVLLEHFLPRVRETNLADGRRGLAFLELELAGREPELAPAERDGAGGDDHDFLPAGTHRRDVRGERLEPCAIDAARRFLDEQRRSDLHYDPLGTGEACPAACSRGCAHAIAN